MTPLLPLLLLASATAHGPGPTEKSIADDDLFRERIAPILEQRCGRCHGTEARRVKGGLLMDNREALLAGGDSGPAIVPGDSNASLLIRAVRYTDGDLEMPPKGRISAEEVAELERWVELGAPWPPAAIPDTQREALRFFEADVRPVFAARCYECHGPEVAKPEGGLRMTGRAALLAGGPSGPAIVPGDAAESLLMRAVGHEDPDLRMPPEERITQAEMDAIATWIDLGAPWPTSAAGANEEGVDIEAGRSWWSFQPLTRPEPPILGEDSRASHPIDAFVLARLDQAGLVPNPAADARTLVRRATFDLWGLPPTFEEVQAYITDGAPGRWGRLIDRLLASPRYGERWGRRWLDVVRYADTNGYEVDAPKPYAWRFRDYVIDSLNADKPYDRFLMEQLAGDELEPSSDEAIVATGLYHLGPWDSEPDDRQQAIFDGRDDVMRTIGEGLMGMSIGCARCHDHKFDPIRQEDYYGLLAFLQNVRPYAPVRFEAGSPTMTALSPSAGELARHERQRASRIEELEARKEHAAAILRTERLAGFLEDLPSEVREAHAHPPGDRTNQQRRLLGQLNSLGGSIREPAAALEARVKKEVYRIDQEAELTRTSFEGEIAWALAAREAEGPPAETRVLVRGQPRRPGRRVEPHFPPVLIPSADGVSSAGSADGTSPLREDSSRGRRRLLAEWLVSPAHPTVARVMVNRLWLGHFGRGIVSTPGDFGAQGSPPTHPQLLDWLASELIAREWSLKALHRLILSSDAYRRSSSTANDAARAVDPDGLLLWRQGLRRLEAEALRDSLLAVSGELSLEMGGPGFYPRITREALASASRPGAGWSLSPLDQRNRRSVYSFAKRGLAVPLLEVFDLADPNNPIGARAVTTVAPQALTLLHSDLPNRLAAALARRVAADAGIDPAARVERLFELALSRSPDAAELASAQSYLASQAASVPPRSISIEVMVPSRLALEYLEQLDATDILHAPREGWRATRGVWGGEYNATLGLDPDLGPAAFLSDPSCSDGRFTAQVRLEPGCERAALILRGDPFRNAFAGIELVLDPPAQEVRLVQHVPLRAPRTLASARAQIEAGRWIAVSLEVVGVRVRARLDGLLDAPLDGTTDFSAPGLLGLRSFGAGFSVAQGVLQPADAPALELAPPKGPDPQLAALESLCLIVLNLNEFAYVD